MVVNSCSVGNEFRINYKYIKPFILIDLLLWIWGGRLASQDNLMIIFCSSKTWKIETVNIRYSCSCFIHFIHLFFSVIHQHEKVSFDTIRRSNQYFMKLNTFLVFRSSWRSTTNLTHTITSQQVNKFSIEWIACLKVWVSKLWFLIDFGNIG